MEEIDFDEILLQASQTYESILHSDKEEENTMENQTQARFAAPVTEDMILKMIDEAIPKSTRRSTLWAVGVWEAWVTNRNASIQGSDELVPVCLDSIGNDEFNKWLACFVIEARNKNGEAYTGGTLYGLCAGIQRYVREKRNARRDEVTETLDIYKDPSFSFFRGAMDSKLKQLHQSGVGSFKRQAEVISSDLENKLWNDHLLGDDTPQKLLDTLVFVLGLNLALRSGKEHRNLKPSMFQLCQPDSSQPPYLLYNECGSKNHQGGLNERKVENKSVKIFSNLNEPNKCPIQLYTKYMNLRPFNVTNNVFYLQPLKNPSADCWYQIKPVGHNTLSQTVKRLCSNAGVEGHYTNHSLRRTCATRLFKEGANDDEIMTVTGHRSSKGLKAYKRISLKQEENISEMLRVKKSKMDTVCENPNQENGQNEDNKENQPRFTIPDDKNKPPTSPPFPKFTFNECTSVTINYN